MSVMSIDTGYFTGSITYDPWWNTSSPVTVSIGTGPDSNGIAWIWEKIEGWDSPDVVGQVLQRGADHGGYPTGQWYAPRALTLQIRASAPNQATRDLARAIFQQVCPPGDLALLKYNEPIPKQVWFRRAGKITETYDNLTEVDFAAVLVAPDPRKYSQTLKQWGSMGYAPQSFSSIGTTGSPSSPAMSIPFNTPSMAGAINAGTFETRPLIIITGPIHSPGVRYVNTGQVISWSNLTLTAGDQLTIDCDSRTGYLNEGGYLVKDIPVRRGKRIIIQQQAKILGRGYFPADVNSQWFTLYPGFNSMQLLSGSQVATDSGTMIAYHRDAWI